MRVLKFTLEGKTAFFKKPDVNTYVYFTYGNIHKVAVLGIIGAAIGFSGYNQQGRNIYPEFYERLKDLKIAIEPLNEKGYIPKKVQTFNNSVGYASFEQGGNLIVKEQWLEAPKWNIYVILNEDVHGEKIEACFTGRSFEFIPYLGKNDHPATIKDIEVKETEAGEDHGKVDSLFIKNKFEFIKEEEYEFDYDPDEEAEWIYEEKLPTALEETANQYLFETFAYTNSIVNPKEGVDFYIWDNKRLFFF